MSPHTLPCDQDPFRGGASLLRNSSVTQNAACPSCRTQTDLPVPSPIPSLKHSPDRP